MDNQPEIHGSWQWQRGLASFGAPASKTHCKSNFKLHHTLALH